jgi:peptidoglycan/LPS O-acetylase OafA/YrhL
MSFLLSTFRSMIGSGAKAGKLAYIDALRGIAALSVLVYHVYGAAGTTTGWQYPLQVIPERLISLAIAGVPLFFIISAFTLYLSLDSRAEEEMWAIKFYLRRIFRIAPLFYLLLILVVLDDLIHLKGSLSWQEVLANFSFTFNLVPEYAKSLFSDGWTVGVEMLFYLVLPLVFLTANSIPRAALLLLAVYWLSQGGRVLLGAVVGEGVMASTNYNFYNIFYWAYIFPLGILCYLIYKSHLPRISREYRAPVAAVMLSISLIILFIFINNFRLNIWLSALYEPLGKLTAWKSMSSIAFALMTLSLSLLPENRLIVNSITRFYGTISYSLYLIHPFFVPPLKPLYGYLYSQIGSADLCLFLCVLITLLIATPISLLTYHWIETPGIRLGKRILKGI